MNRIPGADQPIRMRVATACDVCKLRKVKCDGNSPCGYCVRRQRGQSCHYSPPQRRRQQRTTGQARHPPSPQRFRSYRHRSHGSHSSSRHVTPPVSHGAATPTTTSPSLPGGRREADPPLGADSPSRQEQSAAGDGTATAPVAVADEHDEAEVPREARLLCDAQGKLIFIGDCAPLSFFQTVRRLVTSRVDADAFAPQTSRYSVLENNPGPRPFGFGSVSLPAVNLDPDGLRGAVAAYLAVTTGLVDLFDNARLVEDLALWAGQGGASGDDMTSAVNYLVLAIGWQKADDRLSQAYFDFARDRAFANLGGNLSVSTAQAFLLITLYMLGACQISGAFLFFGIAVRSAYSIGLHRTEVNARFGPEMHRQRDRLWKSLRVVDLFLSTSMGRPPATSDVDCTVSYHSINADSQNGDGKEEEEFDLLNASVQIFLIIEGIVLEVYSRRKISLQLTEGISRELRDWSARWLAPLKEVVSRAAPSAEETGLINGACLVLSSYYYAVILVSRPFLMYELHRRLAENLPSSGLSFRTGSASGKSKLADACIDAASLMVDPVHNLIGRNMMTRPAPVVVSWSFASSLVLGLGLLGGFGRTIEKYCHLSIGALEYFAESDTHAMQYSLIAKSLLSTALEHLDKKEAQERQRRTESSAQLFGLIPKDDVEKGLATQLSRRALATSPSSATSTAKEAAYGRAHDGTRVAHPGPAPPRFGFDISDSPFFGLSDALPTTPDLSIFSGALETDADQSLGALNLFPLLDTSGHIDLAHYF